MTIDNSENVNPKVANKVRVLTDHGNLERFGKSGSL